jgi:hypothetical protein
MFTSKPDSPSLKASPQPVFPIKVAHLCRRMSTRKHISQVHLAVVHQVHNGALILKIHHPPVPPRHPFKVVGAIGEAID